MLKGARSVKESILALPPQRAPAGVRRTRPKAMAGLPHVTPPCELLVDLKPHWLQTYVVLGDHEAKAAFKAFASAQAVIGAGMWAIHQTRNETYLVITLGKAGCKKSEIRKITGPRQAAWDRQH